LVLKTKQDAEKMLGGSRAGYLVASFVDCRVSGGVGRKKKRRKKEWFWWISWHVPSAIDGMVCWCDLDLALDHVDGIAALHLESDGLPRERLDKDLHATAKAEHKVKGWLLLDVVVGERAAILKLLSRKDEALLVGGDALLVLQAKGQFSVDRSTTRPSHERYTFWVQ
jgi:hypothetical protein